MKLASTICRYLLGLLFTVFGANGFLHFIPQPPPSSAFAMGFMQATIGSHFLLLIFALQLVGGVLLLAGRFVPLALVILGGVIVNILDYHATMDPGGIAPGVVVTVLWFVTFIGYRQHFSGIFAQNAEPANR